GLAVAMITNQSGIARGLLSRAAAEAVNARVAQLLGPFDAVRLCPHRESDGCGCRKPAPGMVLAAAADLGVAPHECVVIGDIGSDVAAARAAGARGVLVPTAQTARLAARRFTEAVIFTSFHQSPLPTALVLRLAGIPRIAAISEDYPGSLLDVRHRGDADIPEPERALALARAAGYKLPRGD